MRCNAIMSQWVKGAVRHELDAPDADLACAARVKTQGKVCTAMTYKKVLDLTCRFMVSMVTIISVPYQYITNVILCQQACVSHSLQAPLCSVWL